MSSKLENIEGIYRPRIWRFTMYGLKFYELNQVKQPDLVLAVRLAPEDNRSSGSGVTMVGASDEDAAVQSWVNEIAVSRGGLDLPPGIGIGPTGANVPDARGIGPNEFDAVLYVSRDIQVLPEREVLDHPTTVSVRDKRPLRISRG
jgi:hypothetical protein